MPRQANRLFSACAPRGGPDYQAPDFGKLQQQEKLFRELLGLDPNSVDAMARLATCLVNQRRLFVKVLEPRVAEEKLKEGYSMPAANKAGLPD